MIEPMFFNISDRFLFKGLPKISTLPESGFIKESMHLREVLFPAPLGPKKPKTSFLKTLNETLSNALNPLKDLLKPETLTNSFSIVIDNTKVT